MKPATPVIVLLLTILLAACGGAPAPPTAEPGSAGSTPPPATGGVVRIGTLATADSLSPAISLQGEAVDIWEIAYDTLIYQDPRLAYKPWLAERYSSSADGKTWTFTLRQGVTWSDGKPLTVDDVVFTFSLIMESDSFGLLKEYTDLFEKVEATDPDTVQITLRQPMVNMEEAAYAIPILPKHIWSQHTSAEALSAFTNVPLVGSGPFVLEEFKQGEFTRLKANKNHWTKPAIDEVIYQIYANPDALVQALQAGQVDMITELPRPSIAALRANPNIAVVAAESTKFRDIVFNVIDPANCPADGGECTGHPALRDLAVRQALAHALDKQQLITATQLGMATPGLSLVPRSLGQWFNSSATDYAYDPARARQLLDERGYADSDGDGLREMPGDPARPLAFRLYIPSDQITGPAEAELIAAMWREVGVDLAIQTLDLDTVISLYCPAFDYDLILWGWYSAPDPSAILSLPVSSEIETCSNETGYSNPAYDKLYEQQLVALDKAQRKELIWQMQTILIQDLPYIIPYYQQEVQAYRTDRFSGWLVVEGGILWLQDRLSITGLRPVSPPS